MEHLKSCFKENKPFSIVDYYKRCKSDNRNLAEKEFKKIVNEISTWGVNEKSKNLISFCVNTIKNNYQLLESNDARKYWIGISKEQTAITLEEVNLTQANNYAQTLLKIAGNSESDKISENDPFEVESDREYLGRIPSPDDELAALLPRKLPGVISPVRLGDIMKDDITTESDYLLGGINFSEKFCQFKQKSITKLEQENEIIFFCDNFNEILSLSHILWLEAETYSDLLIHVLGKNNLGELSKTVKENFKKSEKIHHDIIAKLYNIFEENDDDHTVIDDELFELEAEQRNKKFGYNLSIIRILRQCVASLPSVRMEES